MSPSPSTTVGRQVLWSATLGDAPLHDRIDAAIANRFQGLTVWPYEDADDVRRARGEGLEHLILEALVSWYDHEPPPRWFPQQDVSIDDHLRVCEAFGVQHDTLLAPFPTTTETTESLTQRFAVACDRFAEVGVDVHLEFVPAPPIGSLATAWQIVQDAGRPNGGILFDTWHFFRGEPDLDLIGAIPGDRIFSVQINDGADTLKESLSKDTFRHRLLPGHGVFDLPGVLEALRSIGGLNLAGPEVLNEELFALPPTEAVRLAADALDEVLAGMP
jgi:sugar phosphate isomerase/epimerase